jgi:hypothetical protein
LSGRGCNGLSDDLGFHRDMINWSAVCDFQLLFDIRIGSEGQDIVAGVLNTNTKHRNAAQGINSAAWR